MARRARLAYFSLALFCGMPARALAWTEAQVSSVAARVELGTDASVRVRLDLKVGVHGGFLTELELAGLDPGLELDPTVPIVLTAVPGGELYTPAVEVKRDGRVVLRFRTREAPRRGQYEISLAYAASLVDRGVTALDSGDVRFTWTLPGWRSGLDAVRILVIAPPGARPEAPSHWDDRTVTIARHDRGDRVEIELTRAHLPRTVPWLVHIDLPRSVVAPSLRAAVTERDAPRLTPSSRRTPSSSPFVVAGVAALLAVLKRWAFARAAKRRDAATRPLVPVSAPVHALLVLVAALAAGSFAFTSPVAGFVGFAALTLLTVQRTPMASPRARLGGFRPMTSADRKRARLATARELAEPVALLDAGSPLGFLLAASAVAGLAFLHAREPRDPSDAAFSTWHALVFLACQWLLAGRKKLPSLAEERLLSIVRWAASVKQPADAQTSFALRLVVHADAQGNITDARVRVVSEGRANGLLRMDLACADRALLSGHVPTPVWLVVTRAESEADAMLGRALAGQTATVAPGGRRARVLPFSAAALRALMPLLRGPAVTMEEARKAS